MEIYVRICVSLICCITMLAGQRQGEPSSPHPPGHMQPIGSDRAPEGPIDTVNGFDTMEPEPFYNAYIKGSKPLLFKGGADIVPAYHKWTDQYLRDKYGEVEIMAEKGKKETRTAGTKSMKMSQFLDTYREADMYMVQDVVDVMKGDVIVPKPIICGGYADAMQTAVIWFSSGGTKSVLHSDDIDNINCLLDGSKHLYMVNKTHTDRVTKEDWVENGGYSRVDVEKVDMYKFPSLRDLPWFSVTMQKGDCLFIPHGWYHSVSSTGPRNLAVNLWFSRLRRFNKSDCERKAPLAEAESLQGYVFHIDREEDGLREILLGEFEGKTVITLEDFTKVMELDASKTEIQKVFAALDLNADGSISAEEVQKAPLQQLMGDHPWLIPQGQSAGDSAPVEGQSGEAEQQTDQSGADQISKPKADDREEL